MEGHARKPGDDDGDHLEDYADELPDDPAIRRLLAGHERHRPHDKPPRHKPDDPDRD